MRIAASFIYLNDYKYNILDLIYSMIPYIIRTDGGTLKISCTKQCFLLYRRINCFVQKIAFFCTSINKALSNKINYPTKDYKIYKQTVINPHKTTRAEFRSFTGLKFRLL